MVKKKRTFLLIGLGELGGKCILPYIVRRPEISKIITADKNESLGRRRTNLAEISAIQDGYSPNIEFTQMNLFDVEDTAEKIKIIEPYMIFASPTLLSWWVYLSEPPQEVVQKLSEAMFGPWLPMHLTLIYKLMQAIKKSGLKVEVDTHVVTSPYPDVVNPVLKKIGLTPTTGISNIAEIVPFVRKVVSQKLKVPVSNVTAFIVGHHYVDDMIHYYHSSRGAPYFLKVLVGDRPIPEEELKPEEIISAFPWVPLGPEIHPISASVSIRVIMGIWNDTGELCHAPAPNGLPGGYPIRASADGVEVFLPEGITLKEAIKINEEGARFDGIEEIKDDGTVVFTEKHSEIMKEVLGYDCRSMRPDESEERAKELGSLYRKLLSKYGRISKATWI